MAETDNHQIEQRLVSVLAGNDWPAVTGVRTEDDATVLELAIGPEVTWFDGHFPEFPVLPGVVQVHWATECARLVFPQDAPFRRVENLKFKTVIQPDARVGLVMSHDGAGKVRFAFRDGATVYSEGRIVFSS